ncbi:MAG: anthranilate synthase component I [Anaerolineae bacterium]|nr:anthranilate synthase component I [Anaerolineae bacterium]MDW8070673.1 anthranilate synthase component I [Anaerolineae bacterium]
MYQPPLAHVERLAEQGNLVPVWRELPADMETPVSVYLKLQDEGPSFLLESITGGEQVARYSFIGVRPRALLSVQGDQVRWCENGHERVAPLGDQDALDALKAVMRDRTLVALPGLPRFRGGAVGFLAYDAVRRFERLPTLAADDLGLPEAAFMLADTLVAFDHARQRLLVISLARLNGDTRSAYQRATARIEEIVARLNAPIPLESVPGWMTGAPTAPHAITSNYTPAEFAAMVRRAKEYIAAGDIFQVVLSQRLAVPSDVPPFAIYRALRRLNPSPYMVFMRFPGGLGTPPLHIIAASPEMHVRLEGRVAELRPIAGTRPRGLTDQEDAELAAELLADEKERAEHVMLVDLGRNDLGRVCTYGSVHVAEMMTIERYSHVMHIVSDIRGQLRAEYDAFDLLRATFPAGTVTGAPKVRAMEIIEELERVRRGIYAGVIGYVGYDGWMDSCIAIRTIVMQGNMAYIQAGAGVVADSEPAREYQETLNKARALAEAVQLATTRGAG